MKYHHKETIKLAAGVAIVVLFIWVWIATTVFRFRHPWATETEVVVHLLDAVTFQKLSYDEMRRRD
jgi:hypothetical protein